MRVLLLANPNAGGRTAAEQLVAFLEQAGASVELAPIDAVHELAQSPFTHDRLVVAGGDGSIGPAAELAANFGVPFAVIPSGTANDFARALELPLDEEQAARLAADPGARTRAVDLARASGRPFVNAASAGLSVDAAEQAEPHKARLGPLAYAVGALRAGLRSEPIRARVQVDGREVFDGEAWQVVVASTGHFGGGSRLGDLDPSDRVLDVAVVPRSSRLALVRRAYGMRSGTLTGQDDVVHATGRELLVSGPREYNVDGELCEVGPEAAYSAGERIEVVVP